FLPEAPVIDGMLDRSLQKLPRCTFTEIWKSDPKNPLINKEYCIAYGASFLYLYIEVEADSFICRDRGYQNGDGFILVLAVPRPDDKPTDEFYVMGFSPQAQRNREWQRKMIWYRNIDLSFKRLTKAQFEVNNTGGKIGFELLLPWEDVYPYHPWLSESIGFNLTFVKAMPENGKNYHFVMLDEYIGSEQQKRRYLRLNFKKPQNGEKRQSYLIAGRNHLTDADSLRLLYASLADSAFQDTVEMALTSTQERKRYVQKIAVYCESGLVTQEIILNISKLTPGDYLCKWISGACNAGGTFGLTILPEFDFYALAQDLDSLESRISPGSLTTLTYKLQHIYTNLTALKIYDTCPEIRSNIMEFLDIRDMAANGEDLLAYKTGIFRRAYRSKIDNSLQPYSVKIPKDFDPVKKYPLFVYLHGSGEDDQKVLAYKKRSPGNFIELAPYGRGTSTCYSIDNAQQDIQEAIDDVIANYSIDTTRIVLAGFSMGGYGVYRTHYEYPNRFKALAIFSGHPDLANNWGLKGHHPNFLELENVTKFNGMPVFIFHGTEDRNCPFEVTQQLVQKLKDAGANVAFYTENVGHQAPGKKITQQFFRWLENVVQKN
ncbi:prolyl oligopeptidase family serine peptidase, partial [candidate division KSB1 bacterium]|nr:prolyl oligopeptidase family serine peptidase [candidate division KSB1 bacterium]